MSAARRQSPRGEPLSAAQYSANLANVLDPGKALGKLQRFMLNALGAPMVGH